MFCIQSEVNLFHFTWVPYMGGKNQKLYFQADSYFLLAWYFADGENISHKDLVTQRN